MIRLAWAADIHLVFPEDERLLVAPAELEDPRIDQVLELSAELLATGRRNRMETSSGHEDRR